MAAPRCTTRLPKLSSRFPSFSRRFSATILSAANGLNGFRSSLSQDQRHQIAAYVTTLLQWNQRMNLTSVAGESEVMTRHVEDSLAMLPPLERAYSSRDLGACDGLSLVDIGSGAGLPGLILAIARPRWNITLLESMRKRCTFLEHVVGEIGLSNVHVVCDRAENVGQNVDFRERFDVSVARAVAELRILVEYCLPLVRVGGLFVAAKGFGPQEEVKGAEKAVHLLGGSVLEIVDVDSHSPFGQRTAVICCKERGTPKRYPRCAGVPAKDPL